MVQHIPSAGYVNADDSGVGMNASVVQVNIGDVGGLVALRRVFPVSKLLLVLSK